MIEIRDLNKKYVDRVVFSHFDLKVADGERVYISGASGSGKTTLFRILTGLEKYTGEVRISERPAVVFQEPRLFENRTVLENLLIFSPEKREKATEKALETLEKLGIGETADAFPEELSGGMKQRVSLARALTSGRRDLFLDEPFSALDETSRELALKAVEEYIGNTGGTLLLISHQKEDGARLCTRTVVIPDRRE